MGREATRGVVREARMSDATGSKADVEHKKAAFHKAHGISWLHRQNHEAIKEHLEKDADDAGNSILQGW